MAMLQSYVVKLPEGTRQGLESWMRKTHGESRSEDDALSG